MKCSNCGNNLTIDNEVCPYCGSKNPYAVKHREDMKRFSQDYDDTKKEVVEKSGRFNERTFKIAIVAVTIAAIAILAFFGVAAEDLKRQNARERMKGDAEDYIPEIERLMAEGDYIGFYDYFETNNLIHNDLLEERYWNEFFLSSMYCTMYSSLLEIREVQGTPEATYSINLGQNIRSVNQRLNDIWTDENVFFRDRYAEDVKYLFKTLLNISYEDFEEMRQASDNKRNAMLEEAINEFKKEK